jgi:ATP-dependent DNA helicase RecQ
VAKLTAPPELGDAAHQRLLDLKAWRGKVAKEHNLPAYVIFHDATLSAIAHKAPKTLDELQGISGMGVKKLQAYAHDVLRVIAQSV